MKKQLTINLMTPPWVQFAAMGEIHGLYGEVQTLKSCFRNELWDSGWRDGVEIKATYNPPVINYEWEE